MYDDDLKTLQAIKGIGPKRSQKILTRLSDTGRSLEALFGLSAAEIVTEFKIPKAVAEALRTSRLVGDKQIERPLDQQSESLASRNIRVLSRGDSDYPDRLATVLGAKSPSPLYVWGNLDLWQRPAVGFCGSRDASPESLSATYDIAAQVARLGWVVVSGHARGVDTSAHRAALENGGSTIIVAPEGILGFKLRQELKRIARPEQILIVSEFKPQAHWSVGNAMTRNRTIIALSDAMVLIEARSEGGTFEAGKMTLRLGMPLFVALYQKRGSNASGNQYFVEQGATAIEKDMATGQPQLATLKQTVSRRFNREPENISEHPSQQLLLPIT
ncbi:MAG: DNA-processing protein DprA [Anaerolineae bacterium]|nr:DNA-processing protein DprA [Anaerolineae bacterium]